MASNTLGFIKKDSDVEQLSVCGNPISVVLVGDTGDLTGTRAGATVAINKQGTSSPLTLPRGYQVYRTDIRVITAPTCVNTGTAAAKISVATDKDVDCFNTAELVSTFPLADPLIAGNVVGTYTTSSTDDETLSLAVTQDALTAGRLQVIVYLYAAV